MMSTTQPALPQPERSGRLKMSISAMITIQIQITNAEEDQDRPQDVQERVTGCDDVPSDLPPSAIPAGE